MKFYKGNIQSKIGESWTKRIECKILKFEKAKIIAIEFNINYNDIALANEHLYVQENAILTGTVNSMFKKENNGFRQAKLKSKLNARWIELLKEIDKNAFEGGRVKYSSYLCDFSLVHEWWGMREIFRLDDEIYIRYDGRDNAPTDLTEISEGDYLRASAAYKDKQEENND